MAVNVIDTIKPKNQGTFPIVEAVDVKINDSKRLDAALNDKAEQTDLTALEAEVDAKADSSALTTAAANLQAQIDKIISPVTQDAEVQNARVGSDGTSYQTLKSRLDSENNILKEDLSNLCSANILTFINGYGIVDNHEVGDVVDLTPVANNYIRYCIVPCKYQQIYILNVSGAATYRAWCFIDDDNIIISRASSNLSLDNYALIVPENATKLILHDSISPKNSYHLFNIEYVTPEMFGAVGDGITNDTVAVQSAFDSGYNVVLNNDYYCTMLTITQNNIKITVNGKIIESSCINIGTENDCVIGLSLTGKGEIISQGSTLATLEIHNNRYSNFGGEYLTIRGNKIGIKIDPHTGQNVCHNNFDNLKIAMTASASYCVYIKTTGEGYANDNRFSHSTYSFSSGATNSFAVGIDSSESNYACNENHFQMMETEDCPKQMFLNGKSVDIKYEFRSQEVGRTERIFDFNGILSGVVVTPTTGIIPTAIYSSLGCPAYNINGLSEFPNVINAPTFTTGGRFISNRNYFQISENKLIIDYEKNNYSAAISGDIILNNKSTSLNNGKHPSITTYYINDDCSLDLNGLVGRYANLPMYFIFNNDSNLIIKSEENIIAEISGQTNEYYKLDYGVDSYKVIKIGEVA